MKYEYPKRNCELCGNEFTPKRADSVYCCRKCSQKAYKLKTQNPRKRKCVQCGDIFVATHGGEKYCSEKCRKKVINNINKARYHKCKGEKPPTPLVRWEMCLNCGEFFVAKSKLHKYCCETCSYEYRHKKEPIKKICEICGREFTAHAYNSKYCSDKCRSVAQVEHNKINKKKYGYKYNKDAGVEKPKKKKKKKYSLKAWNNLSSSERRELMTLQEVAVEDRKYHLSYGQAEKAQRWGLLPEDYGKREKTVEVVNENY